MIERSKLRWNGWGWAAHEDGIGSRAEVWGWLASELGMPSLLATPARPFEEIALPAPRLTGSERNILNAILGADRVRDSAYERVFHAYGRSYYDLLRLRDGKIAAAPDAVVYPRSASEVLKVLAFASEAMVAVIPFGGGTSVVGGVSATSGPFNAALSVDVTALNNVIGIDADSRTATAEAGIYGPALEKALEAKGFTLGHYPQSFEFSTLGGWIAHRGAGQTSDRYGRAEDWLLSAELATPRGMLRNGVFPASAAGPNIANLVAGSEGIFGIITRATVRIRPVPERVTSRAYLFHDFAAGTNAIREAAHAEIPIAMLRLSDADETRFYRAFGDIGKSRTIKDSVADMVLSSRKFGAEACILIAAFEGDVDTVDFARKRFDRIAKSLGAMALGSGPGDRWRERRFQAPYMRDPMMDRGLGVDTLETATSWAKLPALYEAVRKALQDSIAASVPRPGARGIVMCHISHSYADGASLYFTYIFPRALNGGDIPQWQAIKKAASDAIVAHGGTISHHHGVGEDHLPWIAQEKGALGLDVLRAVKSALDPKGILNPGKLIPPALP